jgi:hypothetical protein
MHGRAVVDGAVTTTRQKQLAFSVLVILLALASPANARAPRKHPAAKPTAETKAACEQPCAHIEDCPQMTCECAEASGSGVAACDTETRCCASPATACESFCDVHHQKWTGRFTPETGATEPATAAGAPEASATPLAAPCDEPCQKPEDCRTIICQCAHTTAPDVAACDAKTHCCGSARIVCEHFCKAKKDKWTGKFVDSPPPDTGSSLDEPDEDDMDEDTE